MVRSSKWLVEPAVDLGLTANGYTASMLRTTGQPVILIELMRFACALAVMGYHYGVAFWMLPGVHPAQLLAGLHYLPRAASALQFGWLGVEVFFVISGLVIVRSALCGSALAFLKRRALRLLPAAWVCATISLVLIGGVGGLDQALLAGWGRAVLFWPVGTPIDGSYWTLGIELAFYLAVAVCIAGGAGPDRIEHLAIAIGLVSLLFWIGCTMGGSAGAALMEARETNLLLLRHGCLFAVGALIARCQADGIGPLRVAAIAATLAGSATEIAVHAIQTANDTGLPRAIGLACVLFVAAAAMLAGAERAQAGLTRWIRPEVARALGMITYPLYLVHQDAGAALSAVLIRSGVAPALALIVTGATMLVIAMLVAHRAEPWLRGRLVALLSGSRARRPDSRASASPPAGLPFAETRTVRRPQDRASPARRRRRRVV